MKYLAVLLIFVGFVAVNVQETDARCLKEPCYYPNPPRVVDKYGNTIDFVLVNQQVQITTDLGNPQDREQPFVFLVQITDTKDNSVVKLGSITGVLGPRHSFSPSQSWVPDKPGYYEATTYVWESLEKSVPLSSPKTISIEVISEDIKKRDGTEVICDDNHVPIQKYDGSQACVKPDTKQKLVERGWTTNSNKSVNSESLPTFDYVIKENGSTYGYQYQITGGMVDGISYERDTNSLILTFSEAKGGYIQITLVDVLFSSPSKTPFANYTVTIDGEKAEFERLSPILLKIPFEEGTKKIKITNQKNPTGELEYPDSSTDSLQIKQASEYLSYKSDNTEIVNSILDKGAMSMILQVFNQGSTPDKLTLYLPEQFLQETFSIGPDCPPEFNFILVNGMEIDYDSSKQKLPLYNTAREDYFVYDFMVPTNSSEVELIGTLIGGPGPSGKIKGIEDRYYYYPVPVGASKVLIHGRFTHECGDPIADGTVTIKPAGPDPKGQVTQTNDMGYFEFEYILPQHSGQTISASLSAVKDHLRTSRYEISLIDAKEADQGSKLKSPLQQARLGVIPSETICKEDLALIQKLDGHPACVKPDTIQKLIERGWTSTSNVNLISESQSRWNLKTEAFVSGALDQLTPIYTVKIGGSYSATAILTKPQGWSDPHPNLGYVMYVQVLDPNGEWTAGSWHHGTIKTNQTVAAGTYWSPEHAGNYTIEVFAWQSFTGTPHADVSRIDVKVKE